MKIIGLDGGATKMRGTSLEINSDGLILSSAPAKDLVYSEQWGKKYNVVPLSQQLEEFKTNSIALGNDEKEYGQIFIKVAFQLIQEYYNNDSVLVGIGMPGIKTADKKGIAVMANGPRIPNFISDLTHMLEENNIKLQAPIKELGSDADYCGLGEEYSIQGKLRGIQNAFYFGIGTGIADALKLNNKLLNIDSVHSWLPKSWEMVAPTGKAYEKTISMSAIGEQYKTMTHETNIHAGHVFERALQQDKIACDLLRTVAYHLALLAYDRIFSLAIGGTTGSFIANREYSVNTSHEYCGMTWDRIVLGQRLGIIWQNSKYNDVFQKYVLQDMADLLQKLPNNIQECYDINKLFVASSLEEAPLYGAGIAGCLYS